MDNIQHSQNCTQWSKNYLFIKMLWVNFRTCMFMFPITLPCGTAFVRFYLHLILLHTANMPGSSNNSEDALLFF